MTPRRGRWIGEPKGPDLTTAAPVVIAGADGTVVTMTAEDFRRLHPLAPDAYRRRWRLLSRKARAKAP